MSFFRYFKKHFIKPIDYFGKSFEFNIMGKTKVNSTCGGILTIILGIAYLLIFSYNISKFFNYEPIVTVYNQTFDTEKIHLMPFNFKFLTSIVKFNKDDKSPIISSPYSSESHNFKTDFYKYYTLNIGNFVSCKFLNDNMDDYKMLLNKFSKEIFTCFNYTDETQNIKMGGSIFSEQGHYQVSLYYKQNISLSDDGFRFIFSIINNVIDVNDNKGYKKFIDTYSEWIQKGSNIKITDRIVKNIIRTDVNLIFNFFSPDELIFYTHNIEIISNEKSSDDKIIDVEMVFNLNTIYNLYNRSYMSIDTLLANSLSVIQALILILQLLDYIFNNQTLENKLIKYLYRVDINREKKISLTNKRNSNINSSFTIRNINTSKKTIKLNNTSNSLYPNFSISNKSSKRILKMKSILLQNDLNIIINLKKLIEYENLKYILLEKYQIDCLRITNRRILNKYDEDKIKKEIYEEDNLVEVNYLFKKHTLKKKDLKLKELLT